MRKAKIVCTIGPACETVDVLKSLMLAGMNAARFHFPHGTHEQQREKFQRLLQARQEPEIPVAATAGVPLGTAAGTTNMIHVVEAA